MRVLTRTCAYVIEQRYAIAAASWRAFVCLLAVYLAMLSTTRLTVGYSHDFPIARE
jgi:hypothetical protein